MSPDQLSGYLKGHHGNALSHETNYPNNYSKDTRKAN